MLATFNEKGALTSRKYVAQQDIVMPNWSKIIRTFRLHSSVFAIEKLRKNLNFQSFLPLIGPLVAPLNKTRAPTSRKYLAKKGIVMPNWSKTFQTFWSHSSTFSEFFLPLINPLVATFNKTRTLTSRKYVAQQDIMMPNWSKIIQNFWSHSSILLYIEKLRKNLNFQSFFTSNRPFGGYF